LGYEMHEDEEIDTIVRDVVERCNLLGHPVEPSRVRLFVRRHLASQERSHPYKKATDSEFWTAYTQYYTGEDE